MRFAVILTAFFNFLLVTADPNPSSPAPGGSGSGTSSSSSTTLLSSSDPSSSSSGSPSSSSGSSSSSNAAPAGSSPGVGSSTQRLRQQPGVERLQNFYVGCLRDDEGLMPNIGQYIDEAKIQRICHSRAQIMLDKSKPPWYAPLYREITRHYQYSTRILYGPNPCREEEDSSSSDPTDEPDYESQAVNESEDEVRRATSPAEQPEIEEPGDINEGSSDSSNGVSINSGQAGDNNANSNDSSNGAGSNNEEGSTSGSSTTLSDPEESSSGESNSSMEVLSGVARRRRGSRRRPGEPPRRLAKRSGWFDDFSGKLALPYTRVTMYPVRALKYRRFVELAYLRTGRKSMRHTDPKNARQLEQMCVLALRELFSREQIVRCARQHARPEIIELESGQMFEMTAAGIAVVQCVGEPPNRRGKHERHDRDRQTKNKGHVDRKGKHREAREPKGKGKNREERGGNRRRQKSSS